MSDAFQCLRSRVFWYWHISSLTGQPLCGNRPMDNSEPRTWVVSVSLCNTKFRLSASSLRRTVQRDFSKARHTFCNPWHLGTQTETQVHEHGSPVLLVKRFKHLPFTCQYCLLNSRGVSSSSTSRKLGVHTHLPDTDWTQISFSAMAQVRHHPDMGPRHTISTEQTCQIFTQSSNAHLSAANDIPRCIRRKPVYIVPLAIHLCLRCSENAP
jgi:hypothetical protein